MAESSTWQQKVLNIKRQQDFELAEHMALDFVNILSVTPHVDAEGGTHSWTIVFEYSFLTGSPLTYKGTNYPDGVGGWRKYAVVWPGELTWVNPTLSAGINYCYDLAKRLREELKTKKGELEEC